MARWKKYLLYPGMTVFAAGLLYLLIETIMLKNTGFETKTLWDWMELLIIPFVLAIGALVLNQSERETERETARKQAKLEREIAKDRQQEAALQSYIDRMSELLLKEKLRTTEEMEVRDVARTRTISVMRVLDTSRNNLVVQFLREAKLVTDEKSILNGANMAGMELQMIDFSDVYVQEANLFNTHLEGAHLEGAHLEYSVLCGAHLEGANLEEAFLEGVNLKDANLGNATIPDEQLAKAYSLKGATMPDGTMHA